MAAAVAWRSTIQLLRRQSRQPRGCRQAARQQGSRLSPCNGRSPPTPRASNFDASRRLRWKSCMRAQALHRRTYAAEPAQQRAVSSLAVPGAASVCGAVASRRPPSRASSGAGAPSSAGDTACRSVAACAYGASASRIHGSAGGASSKACARRPRCRASIAARLHTTPPLESRPKLLDAAWRTSLNCDAKGGGRPECFRIAATSQLFEMAADVQCGQVRIAMRSSMYAGIPMLGRSGQRTD